MQTFHLIQARTDCKADLYFREQRHFRMDFQTTENCQSSSLRIVGLSELAHVSMPKRFIIILARKKQIAGRVRSEAAKLKGGFLQIEGHLDSNRSEFEAAGQLAHWQPHHV